MRRKVSSLEGGRNVIETGAYKLEVCDFKITDGNKGPYVVVDVMVVGPEHQKEHYGKHAELGFSTVGVALKPWLLAMGMSEDDDIELDDKDELESILRTHCKGKIIFAEVEKIQRGEFWNNTVEKPWANVYTAELSDGDYQEGGGGVPF